MDWKIELVAIPVTDVDRAKAFYVEQVGFNSDHDHTVSDEIRFVQLTPPGSACSIAFGNGVSPSAPGSLQGLQLVVPDVRAMPVYRQCAPPMRETTPLPHCRGAQRRSGCRHP